MKNLLNLIRKEERKLGDLIDKKPPKLDKEMKKKPIICWFVYLFIESEKPPKLG